MFAKHSMIALLLTASVGPGIADDGFTPIHADNQKICSPVSDFWENASAEVAQAPQDGFMAIHMANQRTGSAVANFWSLQAKSSCAMLPL